jgi:hypothetical protein
MGATAVAGLARRSEEGERVMSSLELSAFCITGGGASGAGVS